jgi:toxin ParE1/3/4
VPVVHRRPRVRDDLAEIWDFIAMDSVERADAFIDRFDAAFQTLASQAMIGRARDELATGLRSFVLRRYTTSTNPFSTVFPSFACCTARAMSMRGSTVNERP